MYLRISLFTLLALLVAQVSPLHSYEEVFNYTAKAESKKDQKAKEFFKIMQPVNPRFYLAFGGNIDALFSFDRTIVDLTEINNASDTTTSNLKLKSPAIGFLGMVGYQLNDIVSFEVYYFEDVWKKKERMTNTFDEDSLSLSTVQDIQTRIIQFGPRTLVALPINRYLAPYALLGFMAINEQKNSKFDRTANVPVGGRGSKEVWCVAYALGYGIRSQITENFALRLETTVPGFEIEATASSLILTYSF